MFNWNELYIGYVNLSHREDRRQLMEAELERVGLQAERFEAIRTNGEECDVEPYKVMFQRTRGAIGCMLSQMGVMKIAYEKGKGVMVLEDDLIFATDIKDRLDYIENFVNTKEQDADLIFLGGTVHINPAWWHRTGHEEMLAPYCSCNLGKDAEGIDDERMIRVYGMFSTHAYIIPYEKIPKILQLLNDVMSISIGIDFSLIILQPNLKCFAHIPGSVIQRDNMSDIGNGMTVFSGFATLGEYWFKDRIEEFNYDNFIV